MKKINTLFLIIGVICFIVAGYIIYNEILVNDEIFLNFNEEEEIVSLNDRLLEIGSSLGWLIIVDGINNQDDNGNYNVTFNKDLLKEYSNRQLFTMEYILSYNNYDTFTVLDIDGNKIEESPTSEFTIAYVHYDVFNDYYNSLFGEDFNISKAMKGNTSYDKAHVYYENRRAGSNGVYVSMIQANEVKYNGREYIANVTITYSTSANELIGVNKDTAILKYTKDIDDNIILKSFTLKDR